MQNSKTPLKVISLLIISLSAVCINVGIVHATSGRAPNLGMSQTTPTNPVIKKGDKIFVVIKDTQKQTVPVYNQYAKKTKHKVKMVSTFIVKAVKKINKKKIILISKNRWLNAKDIVKN